MQRSHFSLRFRFFRILSLALGLIGVLILNWACRPSAQSNDHATLFKINGTKVSKGDLNKSSRLALYQVEHEEFNRRQSVLQNIASDQLLDLEAKKLGLKRNDLLKREVEDKTPLVTDAEVDGFYKEKKKEIEQRIASSFTKAKDKPSLNEIKASLRKYLEAQHKNERLRAYRAELQAKYKLEFFDKEPEAPRMDVDTAGNPEKGSKTAKVTLIEFSDFQCPYCGRVAPVLKDLEKEYGNRIRIVFRDFPLSFHKTARRQAEAGGCAHEQGKFWELHDLLFKSESQEVLGAAPNLDEAIIKMAEKAGVDSKKFKDCLTANKYAKEVEKDLQDGIAAGIESTPSFFINGRLLSGTRSLEDFKKVINEELAR